MALPSRGLALIPLLAEALSWLVPGGFENRAPGAWLWAVTLLLVGMNEEMFSRGIVLDRLARAYRPVPAVLCTAALFGLQHFSALALADRGVGDVLGNVALSAIYGLSLASFQLRFRWLWPLVFIHGLADWTTILAPRHYSDVINGAWQVMFIGYGMSLPRGMSRGREPSAPTSAPRRDSSSGSPKDGGATWHETSPGLALWCGQSFGVQGHSESSEGVSVYGQNVRGGIGVEGFPFNPGRRCAGGHK